MRVSPSLVIAGVALFLALGGSAVAVTEAVTAAIIDTARVETMAAVADLFARKLDEGE